MTPSLAGSVVVGIRDANDDVLAFVVQARRRGQAVIGITFAS
jgi:hypothetical protein